MNLSPVIKSLLFIFTCFYSLLAFGAPTGFATIDDPKTVAVVNGYKFPLVSVDLLYKSVSQGKRPMRYGDLVNGLIENRLLAEYAEQEIKEESLMSNNPVGFSVETYLDDQYTGFIQASYHQQLSSYIKENIGASPEAITSFYLDDKHQQLSQLLDMSKRMEYLLTPEQQQAAQGLVIAEYKLPGESSESVTLFDIYRRQNIQGRIKIHQMNLEFIKAQINQFVSSNTVSWWAAHHSGLKSFEIEALKRFIKDRHYKSRVIAHHGVSADIHDDNPPLDEAFKKVTPAEIKQYFNANKEKFKRIEYVEARHIRLADFDAAGKAKAALEEGMEFSEAAKKFSIAKTRNASPAGSLGKVRAEDGGSQWAKSAVFALKEGVVSRPIRSPQADGKTVYWEIFLVDKREENYFDVDSETVRYLAGKEIARKNLENEFLAVRKNLFKTAEIKINPSLIRR
ncbi:peptidylprolyl isomerase [Alkalimarinus coralli]|uniref:peptidylprolyl isomerase n=1 Tax=Alkalimarinus coralli TaxID=2935863 RepID=UPI00202B4CDA|nr:peptidyl-prolyl cis-trans isomerase [Alkalimarinus coralli]